MVKKALLLVLLSCLPFYAVYADPFDPFDKEDIKIGKDDPDLEKSSYSLVQEAYALQQSGRYLEARAKLFKAIKKDKKDYLAYMMLASYYGQIVGHYKLADRYIKTAEKVFYERFSTPPYIMPNTKLEHSNILEIAANIRLNLDDYEGALKIWGKYNKYHYWSPYSDSSQGWLLFKLGRSAEAYLKTKQGLDFDDSRISYSERTNRKAALYNTMGIVLSDLGKQKEALEALNEAYKLEKQMGPNGDPSTPLNNSSEIYREQFREAEARKNLQQALSSPNACEHILFTINMVLQNLEEANYVEAKENLIDFQRCFAQYPLKNEEEHRTLLSLSLGRIALHTGDIEKALLGLEDAVNEHQFFGKIGTTQTDMQAASLYSLAQGLRRANNHLRYHINDGYAEALQNKYQATKNSIRAWWLMRKARQILMEDLKDFEDIHIRHSDSMLEYPMLGEIFAGLPTSLIENKIKREVAHDKRSLALNYYNLYLAENLFSHGQNKAAKKLLDETIGKLRPIDKELMIQALRIKAQITNSTPDIYSLFRLNRSALINYGIRLPIKTNNISSELRSLLKDSIFKETSSTDNLCTLTIAAENELTLNCPETNFKGKGKNLIEALNKLTTNVFTLKI